MNYRLLCPELVDKKMLPMVAIVHAHELLEITVFNNIYQKTDNTTLPILY